MALKTGKAKIDQIGPYTLLEKVGEGAMGAVFRARCSTSGAIVAIKILPSHLAGNVVLLKRFEQEFRAAKSLEHPNAVQALEFGYHNSIPYLVMEFVDGQTLGRRIEELGRLPETEALPIIIQAAQALHQAHQQNLIHRDVKPDNILLTASGQAKLADLGLAKHHGADQDLTRPNSGLGTPNFMAPEQFSDAKHADPRCDIYSLGATLYQAVTGELPFRGRTPLHTLKKKTKNDLTPPRKLVPSLSEHVERTILRAMSVDPTQRPATCLDFVAELTGRVVNAPAAPAVRPAPAPASSPTLEKAKAKGAERRATVRYPSTREGFSVPLSGEADCRWSSKVQDISTGGLSLLMGRRFEPKTVLLVELQATGQNLPQKLLVRVVRVRQQGPGKWAIGCAFARRLSEEEPQLLA
jgi:serine/threonine protein kinase